ncbi:hypothetical protein TIFTF001_019845 [Ficus carica]|uniref:Leucine-rich repeat-containing N-terminal plant-type domain-containing protein n=1 Tax=Ficus carica TaxID=3494 RepID=A0AA88DAH3_FICCA|nr:hypothetical protein TIFTF001_019845 [Ficus carica]
MLRSHALNTSSSRAGESKIGCIEAERQVLLNIKKDLRLVWYDVDPLSSWGNEEEKRDCCKWIRVECANISGHVIRLDLSLAVVRYRSVKGQISSSLPELRYLKHLDMSSIFVSKTSIPNNIGNLDRLIYLDLSNNNISGYIPTQIANLSSLQVLDLSSNYDLTVESLEWVSNLSSLTRLDLSGVDLSKAT